MQNLRKTNETGRSMVEMLGVLAIVGVLSVGGVYGYGVAMKKHKANELLHQASMLATTVSAQIDSLGGDLPETITDFGNTNYGTFSTSVTQTEDKKKFVLTIENVDSSVCDQLKKGGMVQGVKCVDTATSGKKDAQITYYKNLATNDEEGKNSPTGGSGSGPVLDENGCYEVTYQTGDCCQIPKTEKVCPGDTPPDTSCVPLEKESVYNYCLCSDYPNLDESGYDCDFGEWKCMYGVCSSGLDKGKCMQECRCDKAEKKIEGEAVICENGVWRCKGSECYDGPSKGKCEYECPCYDKPGSGPWQCQSDGWWWCPTNSPDGIECYEL